MRVSLVFPPLADATQPYSSLPALAAFLQSRGRHEVLLHDANVEFMRHMLTGPQLDLARAKIRSALDDFDKDSARHRTDSAAYELLRNALLKAPIVSREIDRVVNELQSRSTFSHLGRLDRAKRVLNDALEILGASWFPQFLSASGALNSLSSNAADIALFAGDEATNPFRAFLGGIFLPTLEAGTPGAVGISITYRSQILPAVTLALLIKNQIKDVNVIFGGHIASMWYAELSNCPQVFDWCDYLIAFEGETALDALLSELERGQEPELVPNLAFRRAGRVIITPVVVEDINALPTPDYRGLPLHLYLTPEPAFLVNTSRGCYWSKCEFCSVSPSMRNHFRMRCPKLVLQDIAVLRERHSAQCIVFGDDCVPPRTLKALARGLQQRGMAISWQCEVRFEPQLTRELLEDLRIAGCRNLIFGLESYSPRVLSLMNKGVRHREIRRILDDCRRSGIALNLQLFFGFPGEMEQDARETLEFVKGELHGAATLSFGEFQLQRGSGVAKRPADFGVHLVERQSPLAMNLSYGPVPEHGTRIRVELREEVLKRTRFHSLPLCIDAHTLVYLNLAGVAAMAEQYYDSSDAGLCTAAASSFTPNTRLARRSRQTITECPSFGDRSEDQVLLYDYDLDRAVELSRLAAYIVEQLQGPKSPGEVVEQLSDAIREPGMAQQLASPVQEILSELLRRGMIDVIEPVAV